MSQEPVEALEPGLTKDDLRILGTLPADAPLGVTQDGFSLWQVGEARDTTDLLGLLLTLRGLQHLGYARCTYSRGRKRDLWSRTAKGDEAYG